MKNIFLRLKSRSILFLALVLRLLLSPWLYHDDVTTNYWWGKFAVDFPLRGYYDWLNFGGYPHPDQPMLYILFYRFIRHLYLFFYSIFWYLNINIPLFPSKFMQWYFLYGNQILEKFVVVFFEVFFIFLIYLFIKNEFTEKKALIATLILTFYPPLIYNSAIWGSNDSLLNLLGLSSIYFFYKKKYIWGTLLFTLCILFKSSLFIFAPIIIIILFKNKSSLKSFFKPVLLALILTYLIALPFSTYNPLLWVINIYSTKILPGAMSQLTSNAMNVWALFYGLIPRNDSNIVLNIISARSASIIICLLFYFFILKKLWIHYNLPQILLSLVNIALITFMFLTRMHERYTFPALIPLFLLCFYNKNYIKYFVILTITHLLNVYNWWWIPNFPILISLLKLDLFIRLISLTNLILTTNLFFKYASKTIQK